MKRRKIHFELIPMIDLMMILTLFFSLIAFLPQFDSALDTQLPSSITNEKPPIALTIHLDNKGMIFLEGKSYTLEQLMNKIRSIVDKNPNVPIILAADKNLSYQKVIELLDSLKILGVKRLALATESKI